MIGILCVALSCLFLKDALAVTNINAIVIEGRPNNKTSIKENLKTYKGLLSATDKPDFIVLPEYGLTGSQFSDLKQFATTVPDDISTCDNLTALNEWARDWKAYVVASVIEKDGDKDFYSTTVVVNGTTNLVAKYRKINLNSTEENFKSGSDVVTFDTKNFGKIGLISGNDILYENPSQKVLEDGVNTVIYTAAFRSEAPFKTALSIQQGYAKANGINLLAANLADPGNGFGGSGIYSPNKIQQKYINANAAFQKLSASVVALDKRDTCVPLPKSYDFNTFNTVLVSRPIGATKDISKFNLGYAPDEWSNQTISKDTTDQELCDGSFCCIFTVKATSWNTQNEQYKLVVKKGDNAVCALIQCNSDGSECGKRRDGLKTKFTEIDIVQKSPDETYRPYALLNTLEPIDSEKTFFCQNDTAVSFNITATNKTPIGDLIAFGIVTASGASSLSIMCIQISFLVVILQLFFKST